LDVGLGVDKLDDALNTGQTALNALDHVLHALIGSSAGICLSLEEFNHQLNELHNGEKQGPESQTSPMVSEDHFV
jgi:hypothetical protein